MPLALGTDTAGSGRVPAGLSNIVGLKPSLGLVSTAGVVPACRTLDCVSVFALTVDDAFAALAAMSGPDPADPYSRPRPLGAPGALPADVRIGVPMPGQRLFFGDKASAAAYDAALARLAGLGATIVEIDIEPFYETARLLYDGPWVAERYITARSLIASAPESMHPVTRQIILSGARPSAADAFASFYELEELRRVRDHTFRGDRRAGVADDADGLHHRAGARRSGRAQQPARHLYQFRQPARSLRARRAGVDARQRHAVRHHAARAGRQRRGARRARPPVPRRHRLAARRHRQAAAAACAACHRPRGRRDRRRGGRRAPVRHAAQRRAQVVRRTVPRTHHDDAPDYRLFLLPGDTPAKPGLLRVGADGGTAIDVEIWAMPAHEFGRFVASIPPPLSIGTLALADGRGVKGFLVEAAATQGARDISAFGGWRAFIAGEKLRA